MAVRAPSARASASVPGVRGGEVRASRGASEAAGVNRPPLTSGLSLPGLLLLSRPSAARCRAARRASPAIEVTTTGALR